MAKIGRFKKVGDEFHGSILTLSVQHEGVRIVPTRLRHEAGKTTPPSHLVYAGEAEVGTGWAKQTERGDQFISLKIDDPSFYAPIYPTLILDEGHTDWVAIWSRASAKAAA